MYETVFREKGQKNNETKTCTQLLQLILHEHLLDRSVLFGVRRLLAPSVQRRLGFRALRLRAHFGELFAATRGRRLVRRTLLPALLQLLLPLLLLLLLGGRGGRGSPSTGTGGGRVGTAGGIASGIGRSGR